MTKSNGDLPAMPFQEVKIMVGGMVTSYNNHKGLTKRERFAMAAMQWILSNASNSMSYCARDAVSMADELLCALEVKNV